VASFISVYFHDVSQMTDVFFQMLFFLTPIVYLPSMIVDRGLAPMLSVNPIVAFLEIIRTPLVYGHIPPMWAFSKAFIITSISAFAAIVVIARCEKKLIFRL
jgi:ABC-type polysaccharide/polyol phosphate export permease